ncbi:MAG: YhfC family intramembrane metalloprotease [Clostridiales bacterium]|nr:YhfC family intramembrane metalloprotease [Clostridiales bacterium]
MESFDLGHVSTSSFVLMGIGAFLSIVVPVVIAIVWCRKKKEPFTTVLIGAAVFMLFAVILEKTIQNALIIPGQMGLPETSVSAFINARPFLLAFLFGLFPGVFEETGILIAFKSVLRKRTQRETSITYGIGHGGVEVVFVIGITLVAYIALGFAINSGEAMKEFEEAFKEMDQPWMIEQLTGQMKTITGFDLKSLCTILIERVFAVLFHIGASILVFYACRDKKKFWLYPLAIVIHTLVDGIAALQITGAVNIPSWAIETVFILASAATFLGPYLLLYKRDKAKETVA